MQKFWWLLYQPYKWLIFLPLFIINTLIFAAMAVLVSLTVSQKIGSFIGGVLWARLNVLITPAVVRVRGRRNIRKKQSYVVIANHLSGYDIFVLYGWLGIDFKWVMKKEIKKVPGLGFGSQAVGHIFIDRSNSKAAIETIREARKKIRNGTSVVFFPEGTRSKSRQMLPFKKGAFRFALDLQLPILPVRLRGTDHILPSGTLDLTPGKATLTIGEPIDTSGYTEANLGELVQRARQAIEAL